MEASDLRVFLGGCVAVLVFTACSVTSNAMPTNGSASGTTPFTRTNQAVTFSQFADLPRSPYYFPVAVTAGSGDAIWVADDIDQDIGESAIARISPSGKRTRTFYYPNSASPAFADLVTGPDGALWITDSADSLILRMTTQGGFKTYGTANASPQGIVSGPDGALWFVENYFNGSAVCRMTTDGQITKFTHGISPDEALEDIAVGADGALWFTDETGNRIDRVTIHGRITEYSAGISPGAEPYSIAPGPDGALWFTERAGGRIGRITTSGHVTEYSKGITPTEEPVDLAAGPDGALWFTEYETYGSNFVRKSKIGRISLSGNITEYSNINGNSGPTGIVLGRDGNMWFVETSTNRLGRINLQVLRN